MNREDGSKEFQSDSRIGIILFHAYTGSTADVNPLARKLNSLGYGILCPLFSGHNDSNIYNLLNTGIETWKNQAFESVKYMEKKYESIFVFGLSMGGIFATWTLTQADLSIAAGGVINSPIITPSPTNLDRPFKEYARKLTKNLCNDRDGGGALIEIMNLHHQQLSDLDNFITDFRDKIGLIKQDFYVGQSLKDELIDPRCGQLLRSELKSAQVDFHEFPNNTHVITVDRDRIDFENSIINFIANHIDKENHNEFI